MEFTCEDCGFVCNSQKLFYQHKERERKGLTEQKERELIKKKQQDGSRRNKSR